MNKRELDKHAAMVRCGDARKALDEARRLIDTADGFGRVRDKRDEVAAMNAAWMYLRDIEDALETDLKTKTRKS